MTPKKPVALLALAGACVFAVAAPAALAAPPAPAPVTPQPAPSATDPIIPVGDVDTALTSKSGQTPAAAPSQASAAEDSARVVGIIVELTSGTDRAAALAAMNEAVAGVDPGAYAEVSREYTNAFSGFALKAPAGSLDAIRGVSGVKAAFLEREIHVDDNATPDADNLTPEAEGGFTAARLAGQNPDNLSAQLIMHADQVSQKGAGKVIAVIDTGVDMTTRPSPVPCLGLPPWMRERLPPWPLSWVRARRVPTSPKSSPSPTITRTMTPTRPRQVPTARTSPVSPRVTPVKSWAWPPTRRSSSRRLSVTAAVSRTPRCCPPWMTWPSCAPMS